MNRAERRRSAKQQQKQEQRTYVFTEEQIEKMKMDAVLEATRRAFLMFMSIPVMVLHDKFGFDEIDSDRFMDYALMWFESVENDETRLIELVNVAKNECGIDTLSYIEPGGHQ